MLIGKEWKIESDMMNVILWRKTTARDRDTQPPEADDGTDPTDPTDRWRPVGYYATPKEALKSLVNQKVRDTHLKDLTKVVIEIAKLHALIDATPITREHTMTARGSGKHKET